MTGFLPAFLAGCVTGVLSAFGLGGGSLLLIYLTAAAGMEQTAAQGINLLYFLPAAAAAIPAHLKNGYVDRKTALPAIGAGLVCAGLAAWLATAIDTQLLRKCFGVFLLYIGFRELFRKNGEDKT